ncbi:MAG TPA: hypothetical protein VED01_23660 [Burkholderiales bacterium]|nr:hypothetical protein [Burkholderiales bacterium]
MTRKTTDEQPKPDADTTSERQQNGATGRRAPAAQRNPRMPHERDESARASGGRLKEQPVPSERQITDAQRDVERGLVDTDRRDVPSDVPGRHSPKRP